MRRRNIYGSSPSDLLECIHRNSEPSTKTVSQPTFAHQILWRSYLRFRNYSEITFLMVLLENAYLVMAPFWGISRAFYPLNGASMSDI